MNKMKKTKISIVLSILILISTIATVIGISGNKYTKDKGDYIDKFAITKKGGYNQGIYDLKYNSDEYYTTRNWDTDYDRIDDTKNIICANSRVGNKLGMKLIVAGIIDIDGGDTTITGPIAANSGKTENLGENAKRMAKLAYLTINGEISRNTAEEAVTYKSGWYGIYNSKLVNSKKADEYALKPGHGSDSGNGTWGESTNFSDAGKLKLTDEEKNNTAKDVNITGTETSKNSTNTKSNRAKVETGSWKFDGATYTAKIGPYTLGMKNFNANGVSQSIEMNVTKSNGEQTTWKNNLIIKRDSGNDTSGEYYIYVGGNHNISSVNKINYLKIKQTSKGINYKGRFIILATSEGQSRMVFHGTKEEGKESEVYLKIPILETNVSLQKYITKINGEDLTNNSTTLTNRKNTYSRSDERNKNAKKIVSKSEQNNMQESTYKRDNVVNIEAGDIVTYRIHVYNNSDVNADKVVVRDQLLYYDSNQYGEYQLESIIRDGNKEVKGDWKLASGTSTHEYEYTINNLGANSETYFDISVKLNTYITNVIANTAYIKDTTPTNKNEYRTKDRDYIKMKPYKVSLQKIVYSVNGINTDQNTRWKSWESTANVNNNPSNETYNRNNLYSKHNNPVTVANGDTVRYAIKVRNDGDTQANITKISDNLPSGVSLQGVYNQDGSKCSYTQNGNNIEITGESGLLGSKAEKIYFVDVTVTESNMSTRILRNYAIITGLKNKNGIEVADTTSSNNDDADYIQLKDITIEGTVWNDKALDKKQDNYNGIYDEGIENKLSGIKVELYRDGTGVISTTLTDDNGNYTFDASKIDASIVTEQCERYIKAPYTCKSNYSGTVEHGSNYWKENSYYSYYVRFTYDGITYTSTVFADVTSTNDKDSNAKEDNGVVRETRQNFNNRFSKINNQSGISYTTKNEEEYIPQSNHVYNEDTMSIQSSTNKIDLSNTDSLEALLTHVNLGLRGRDVFDLRLESDVYSTKITVNGETGTYNYDNNKVTVRKSDISVAEDAANFANESVTNEITETTQTVRKTDLDVNTANNNAINKYKGTGLGIEVTYKITVTNESQTDGTATKITNYYDNRYTFKKAYSSDNSELNTTNGNSGTNYKSIIITTPGTNLNQSATMDIYVVYTLNDPTSTLSELVTGAKTRIPTYNLAEIYEYTTRCGAGQTEYTRGLIDKDSAPGSVEKEQVRLTTTINQNTPTTGGNPSTIDYYFAGNNLSELKYEDDTYATPTLYFTSSDNGRTLEGTAFEDKTTVNNDKIRTGDGIMQEDENRVGKITVELMEKVGDNYIVRYRTSTNDDGTYKFTDFLPGNYIVHYNYGNIDETFLYGEAGNNQNKKSYNGEDFQSTNNIGTYGAKKLNDTEDYWYVYNETEKVSTGTDDTARRQKVSETVVDFNDDQMTVLNNAKAGKQENNDAAKEIADKTQMYANTPKMNITVEKTNLVNNECKQNTKFESYNITGMNFGIAEVPITTVDLQKHISSFTIKDSAGTNVIASAAKQENGEWKITAGNILATSDSSLIDVSIEDEKLQGARLEVNYNISSIITVEKNFDGKEGVDATIMGLVDYIDNDLSYNNDLGENSKYWELTDYEHAKESYTKQSKYINSKGEEITETRSGTLDSEGTIYTTIVKAKEGNPLLKSKEGTTVPITLEKTISATDTTVENIITSSINTYEYNNSVEITGIEYSNTNTDPTKKFSFRDRVRTTDRYIILSGRQHDSKTSETITIHPPTGANNVILYSVIAVISLAVLASGVVLIKKYAIKKD